MGSDPGIMLDNYSQANSFSHSMMAKFVKYKFGEYPAMHTVIT